MGTETSRDLVAGDKLISSPGKLVSRDMKERFEEEIVGTSRDLGVEVKMMFCTGKLEPGHA